MRTCKKCGNDTFIETIRCVTVTNRGVKFHDDGEIDLEKAQGPIIGEIDDDYLEYNCQKCNEPFDDIVLD